jgi:hypothetical protein
MNGAKTIVGFLAAGVIGLASGPGSRSAFAADNSLNACGCRQGSGGMCYCEKKSHCGCPGECEPKGCEERRAKQLDKEIQAETKKAEEATRRQNSRRANSRDEESSAGEKSEHRGVDREPARSAPPKVRTVRMTAAQKRDLARLIRLYLAAHPDQRGKAIDQVETEVSRK